MVDHADDDDDSTFDDLGHLQKRLKASLVWQRNEPLCRQVVFDILPHWKAKFSTAIWKKIRKRMVKELNEAEPCIRWIQTILLERQQERPVMIVDLCSGFGILPMILSEVLPVEKVKCIYLIDNSFPMNVENVQPHHISVDHLVDTTVWRIPLRFRKVDLKTPRQKRQLHDYIFPNEDIIFTAIHLCKALSVHAINLYHDHQRRTQQAVGLCLKPCCLPGKRNLFANKQPIRYQFPNYSFCPLSLYPFMDNRRERQGDSTVDPSEDDATTVEDSKVDDDNNDQANDQANDKDNDNDDDDDNDKTDTASCDTEPIEDEEGSVSCCHGFGRGNKKTQNRRFSQWVEHLWRGCETEGCTVRLMNVEIQHHHFQNQYLCCHPTTATNDGSQ